MVKKINKNKKVKKRHLLNSIFSLRKDTPFYRANLEAAALELRNFLNSRGYFNPAITYKIQKNDLYFVKK